MVSAGDGRRLLDQEAQPPPASVAAEPGCDGVDAPEVSARRVGQLAVVVDGFAFQGRELMHDVRVGVGLAEAPALAADDFDHLGQHPVERDRAVAWPFWRT